MKEESNSETSVPAVSKSERCLIKQLQIFLSYSVSSQSSGSEMKPLTYDRGGDNVLLGWSYRTPHGAVRDEYEAMVE
jgi:hypothetical protein